jgi:uncharacterized cupredoxin-like copper-binding protein
VGVFYGQGPVFTTLVAGTPSIDARRINYVGRTQMRSRTWLLVAGITAVAGLVFAGCGASKGSDVSTGAAATAPSTTSTSASGNTLTVKMADYSFTPANPTVKAGDVTISAPNGGQVEHELVLLKTNDNPASLPVNGNEVDEDGLEAKGAESPGEITDVPPGQTKSGKFKLTPGKYVMICNVPGHYKLGMYGSVTVK